MIALKRKNVIFYKFYPLEKLAYLIQIWHVLLKFVDEPTETTSLFIITEINFDQKGYLIYE